MSLTSMVKGAIDAYGAKSGGSAEDVQQANKTILYNIKTTEWGYQSLFQIESMYMKDSTSKLHLFEDKVALNSVINGSILNIETATITHAPIEEWIGGQWVYTTGRPELRQITFTFRETASAWLYRNFNTAYNASRNAYPDDQKWTLSVFMHGVGTKGTKGTRFGDANEKSPFVNSGTLIDTSSAILDSIGSISLDQSSSDDFVTFSVTFKYMNDIHNYNNLTATAQPAKNTI